MAMFSGIVECVVAVLEVVADQRELKGEIPLTRTVWVQRPPEFRDLKVGDSIACNGVCLTLEEFQENCMRFSLGPETLRVLKWTAESSPRGELWNLERSLRLGDRIHGHLLQGHIDELGQVLSVQQLGESLEVEIQVSKPFLRYLWEKGSVGVNGVSLTLNEVNRLHESGSFRVCLIPETLRRTQLSRLRRGDFVNLEADFMAKGLRRMFEETQEAAQAMTRVGVKLEAGDV